MPSKQVEKVPKDVPKASTDGKSRKESSSDIMKEANEVTKVSAHVADAASLASSNQRMSNIRNKFEKGESLDKKEIPHRKAKLRYAGVKSAKSKFMEDAERVAKGPSDSESGRKMKEITPPREGVVVGTLESEPTARPPGVVTSDDFPLDDFLSIGEATKNVREKFKKMEKSGGVLENGENDDQKKVEKLDESKQAAAEATRSAKERWKNIESGNVEQKEVKANFVINLNEAGGIYENDPYQLSNIARGTDPSDGTAVTSMQSAAERREAFLKKAAGESLVKRINPTAELQDLANREKNAIYENVPVERPSDVIASGARSDDFSTLSTAKSLREKFSDPNNLNNEHQIKKTAVDIRGEGGVYENDPKKRDDVIRYDDMLDQPEAGSVKWASSAKERFMKDAEKRSKVIKRTDPILLTDGSGTAQTVFESEPLSSAADARASIDDEKIVGNFASTAKQKYLERQRIAEEAERQKSRPEIMDIWSNMTHESGVFENTPSARPEGIVVSGWSSGEEDDGEDEVNALINHK